MCDCFGWAAPPELFAGRAERCYLHLRPREMFVGTDRADPYLGIVDATARQERRCAGTWRDVLVRGDRNTEGSVTQSMEAAVNQEVVYDLLYREQWPALLDLIHTNRGAIEDDALLHHAVDTFAEVFFSRVDREGPGEFEAEIEKLFLLHVGGYHRLTPSRFEQVVVHLVRLNADRPAAAAGYARHFPDHEDCAAAIGRHDVRHRADHPQDPRISLHRTTAASATDHTVPLFKSRQEAEFFLAARDVFATYLVYPNVALSSVFAFDALRDVLTSEERRYFFRGVIDCVVFDQHDGYRPLHFFEMDSPLHDDAERRERDGHKDRIVSLAGKQLYRIRTRGRSAERSELARLLRDVLTS